jgi:hypothetical protein
MSFKIDDKEWRDEVRTQFLHYWSEALEQIPEDREGTFHGRDREHEFHGKAELIEVMIANTFQNGFADALKKFYEEHGFYPPLRDLSTMPRVMK